MAPNDRFKAIAITLLSALALPAAAATNAPDLNQFEKLVDAGKLSSAQAAQLQEFVLTHPNNNKAHVVLGRYYSFYNLGELAANEFQAALKLDNSKPDIWMYLANEKYRHHKLAETQKILDQAEKRFPKYHDIQLAKGNLYLRGGKYAEAAKYLEKAQASKPSDFEVQVGWAQLCFALKKYPEAIIYADAALKLKPDCADAYHVKARALLALGHRREAFQMLSAGFNCDQLNRDLDTIYLDQAERDKRWGIALEPALAIMAIDVNNTTILPTSKDKVISIIDQWKKSGATDAHIKDAIDRVGKYLDRTTHKSRYFFCIGDIYDRFNQPKVAITYYERGLTIEPAYARAYLRIGEDMELLYQPEKALELYKKAQSINPNDLEIVTRLSALEKRLSDEKNNVLLKWLRGFNFWAPSQPPESP